MLLLLQMWYMQYFFFKLPFWRKICILAINNQRYKNNFTITIKTNTNTLCVFFPSARC